MSPLLILLLLAADPPPEWRAALERITANSMRGHLSFIASDLLEGRDTPSRGQDIAAEYLAAQYRRAGLEPGGNDGYFQTFDRILSEPNRGGFEFTLNVGGTVVRVPAEGAIPTEGPIELSAEPAVKMQDSSTAEQTEGKVLLAVIDAGQRNPFQAMAALSRLKAKLVVWVDPSGTMARGMGRSRIIDPANRLTSTAAPMLIITDPAFAEAVAKLDSGATVTARWKARTERPVTLRNVVALLRGSDPMLKDTAVVLSAHYDHIGMLPPGDGDRIYNGANDDGSGTVGVLETAAALAALPVRPKRSIVFVNFCGEERGGYGSRYFGKNPPFPIEKIVANLNLEQIGRSDSSEGPQLNNLTITGFDYSTVSEFIAEAGRATGVSVYKHEKNSDPFFLRSDNAELARQGVPAHSLSTAFVYPDYHGLGDHWDKIDYTNFEKVTRTIALGLLSIADSAVAPAWNENSSRAAQYLKVWREKHPQ